jgi:phage shock protein E
MLECVARCIAEKCALNLNERRIEPQNRRTEAARIYSPLVIRYPVVLLHALHYDLVIKMPSESGILNLAGYSLSNSRKSFLVLLLGILLLAGCSRGEQSASEVTGAPQKSAGVHTVSPREAAAILEKRRDMLILDVRTANELNEGSIERSMLTPFWSLVGGTMSIPQDRPIMLVCAVGGRSYAAGQLLVRNGFQEVYNLRGGVVAWKHAGLPIKYYRVPRE